MNNAMREPVEYLVPDDNRLKPYYDPPQEQWTDELDPARMPGSRENLS
jgi:hypothetical protein